MSAPIGFVILVNPLAPLSQTDRLIDRLNEMFEHPPIACHFDFSQNPDQLARLDANVRVVRPHLRTSWASFTCVDAAARALGLLYSGPERPDWFVYLSGADYPIKAADWILSDLAASPFDGHIEHLVPSPQADNIPAFEHPESYKGTDWLRHAYRLYFSRRVEIPWITRRLRFTTRVLRPVLGNSPFNASFSCYVGEAWFCANRKCAEEILRFHASGHPLINHYRTVLVPEESYFHTILGNCRSLNLSQNTFRYVDWTQGGSNPKVLTDIDLPALKRSGMHFARKFSPAPDSDFLASLDTLSA